MNDRNLSASDAQLPLDRRRILLIEDHSQLLSTLSAYLFHAGAWDVWQAHSCARAVELWSEHKDSIDVIVVDASLPDGSGLTLLRQLRQDKSRFYALAISGLPMETPEPFPYDTKLSKPFTGVEFITALSKP